MSVFVPAAGHSARSTRYPRKLFRPCSAYGTADQPARSPLSSKATPQPTPVRRSGTVEEERCPRIAVSRSASGRTPALSLHGQIARVVPPPGELALLHPHLIYLRLRRLFDALVEEAGDVVGDVLQVILDGEVTGIEAV